LKNKLSFLISQPRSGSSFLQIQLSYHNLVYSPPESSFLLKYLYRFNNFDRLSYDTNYAKQSWGEFLLNDNNSFYKRELRNFILKIYFNHKNTEKKLFLDKSPRYYHILNDLLEIFPDSKFIILLRNPLAVLSSLLNYHYNNSFIKGLSNYSCHDLFHSLKIFNSLWLDQDKHDNVIFVKYEDIVVNPSKVLNSLFDFLSLNPCDIDYQIDKRFLSSSFVDPNAKKHTKPTSNFLNNWLYQISSLQKKNAFIFYIEFLKNLEIVTNNYDINYLSNLVINKRVKYTPYLLRTNSFFKNSFQFFN
jgi:hypothetical protein